jgi:hypothetical protein
MKITVGEKITDADATQGIENDVYHVDLTFAMVVEPSTSNGDDLIVKLLDADGNVIRQARLAGEGSNDGEEFVTLVRNADHSYTFQDIPMMENSDLTFDLKLEGTQYLKKGVYVYTAPNTDETNTFQTLVGIAEGAQRIGVSAALTFSFDVDDESQYHTEAAWSWEKDSTPAPEPDLTPNPEPDPAPSSDPDPKTPPAPAPDSAPAPAPIPKSDPSPEADEPPLLADVPQTGDNSNMDVWFLLMMLSAYGIALIPIFSWRRNPAR